jgi:hypothetical protein
LGSTLIRFLRISRLCNQPYHGLIAKRALHVQEGMGVMQRRRCVVRRPTAGGCRRVRQLPPLEVPTPGVLGVDDWAKRKGRTYGTLLVWVRLKQVATHTARMLYQVKHDLLSDYMREQLRAPTVQMMLA